MVEIAEMSYVEIESACIKMEDEADAIAHQLDISKAVASDGGEKPSAIWFSKAKYAMQCRRTRLSQIARFLSPENEHQFENDEAQ